jgi:hypothetical protein
LLGKARASLLLLVSRIMHAQMIRQSMLYVIVALLLASGAPSSSSVSTTAEAAQAAAAATADRKLLLKILPNEKPKSVPFDSHLQLRSPDIKQSDARIVKQAPGCAVPEQVGLSPAAAAAAAAALTPAPAPADQLKSRLTALLQDDAMLLREHAPCQFLR